MAAYYSAWTMISVNSQLCIAILTSVSYGSSPGHPQQQAVIGTLILDRYGAELQAGAIVAAEPRRGGSDLSRTS
jgi:hypothetical protein